MRPKLVGLAVFPLLIAAAAAHAQPALVAPESPPGPPSPPSPPTGVYLEPGLAIGVTQVGVYGAVRLDGGYRIGDSPLWIHGRLGQGSMAQIDGGAMDSSFTELRIGLEARGCVLDGIACLVGGADGGYRHEMLMASQEHDDVQLAVAIARLGLDVGTRHLRFRPGVETSVNRDGLGLGVTAGIAYTW
jgi:hypothetical protein